MARVSVLGLNMEDTTRTRVVAAMRGLFPEQTSGLSDGQALQAVLKMIIVDWVSRWEGSQAAPDPTVAAQKANQDAATAREQAAVAARSYAAGDIQTTAP